MKLEDVKDLLKRSQRGEPEASKRMENYYIDMNILEQVLRKKLEDNHGKIEDTEEFSTAIRNKEDMKLKGMVYKFMEQMRELRVQWRDAQIEEDNRTTTRRRRRRATEEKERTRTRWTRSSSSTEYTESEGDIITFHADSDRYDNGTKEAYMSGKRSPATPSAQQLSPRLRLDSHNFKTVKNHHDNAYYEKQIMQEMLQRSYIAQHPLSGYKTTTTEIK
eukprot:6344386-Amphidinium_carterae.1